MFATELTHFLEIHCPERAPLLLALSGGPDSMALFWLLKKIDYPFSVAHVDHGWRSESGKEALFLADLCQKQEVPFFLKKLNPPNESKNLEDEGRRARLAFFKEVVDKEKLEAVLLAHQADDQAETVLKRIFEGAGLTKLRGLLPRNEVGGLILLRPLLNIKKKELMHWLDSEKLSYFIDSTNEDRRFLRARMRQTLIPLLSQEFGKEVGANLCRMSQAAAELEEFVDAQLATYKERIYKEGQFVSLNFEPDPPKERFLWKMAVRFLFEKEQLSLSSSVLESLVDHLEKGSCHKKFQVAQQEVRIHRKKLSIQGKSL